MLQRKLGYDWLIIVATGLFGAYFSSETLPDSSVFESVTNWGPQVDGLYVIPGIRGGVVMAVVAYRDVVPRTIRAGTGLGTPRLR